MADRDVHPGEPNFLAITDATGLDVVVAALENTVLVGVDTETTGLDPRTDRVRLLTLDTDTVDGGRLTYVIDLFALGDIDLKPLFNTLAVRELIFHNAAFDLTFLARLRFIPAARVHDTLLMARLLAAGTRQPCDLQHLAGEILKVQLDKTHQSSDWSQAISTAQIHYAAQDAAVLPPLYRRLKDRIEDAGLGRVCEIEERCIPAVLWMSTSGVPFDADAWRAVAEQAGQEAEWRRADLDRIAEPWIRADLFGTPTMNWDSTPQVLTVFTAAGVTLTSTADAALAALEHPLAQALRDYRAAQKKVSAYGEKFLQHVRPNGRIYPRWHQLGADSGRMSGSDPNMQQMPRGKEYRRCVRAPEGRVLVKADYSQIELRIAAKIANEERMIAAYRDGADLHTLTAQRVLRLKTVTKEQRQLAKALNFGLLYGMGAKGFRSYARANYRVELELEQAEQYRQAFFAAYPALRTWHRRVGGQPPPETRTLTGRRVLFKQARFSEQLNSPVQGTGADGLKLALAVLWERRHEVAGAWPVLAVHDEIVVECDADQAEAVTVWLKRAMTEAVATLLDPVPVVVEVTVASTWGG